MFGFGWFVFKEEENTNCSRFWGLSGGVKLLVDLVAKVGMDRGDGLVLGIHLLAGEYCQSEN